MRRSELLGLRWSAIDFKTGWLHIETTVVREKHGSQILTIVRDNTTKTASSKRSLPLCQYTYQYLWELRQRQLSQMALCGADYNTQYMDFVCVDALGNLLQPDFVSSKFQKILKKYQLRKIRFHDLRRPNVKSMAKNIMCKSRNSKLPFPITCGFCFDYKLLDALVRFNSSSRAKKVEIVSAHLL